MRLTCRPDDLALYAYGFLEGPERAVMESHLIVCPACREEVAGMIGERDLVAFELSLEPGMSQAVPVKKGRMRGAIVRIASAAAAVLLLAAGLGLLLDRGEAPAPVQEWTVLPDGSRYRSLEGADVHAGPGIRRLDLAAGDLLLDVNGAALPFTVVTPHGSVRSEGGRIALSVREDGTVVEVLEGKARVDRPEREPEPPLTPGETTVLVVDPNPELLRRILELEEMVAVLTGEGRADPVAVSPEEAIAGFDWESLVRSLLTALPELRAGRLPEDPDELRRYLVSLAELRALAEATGIPATLEGIARDSRTGSELFGEVLREAWPDVPETDVAIAKEAARRALEDYTIDVDSASSPVEEAAAEEALRESLSREVEVIEEREGPPRVDPVETVLSTAERSLVTRDVRQTADRIYVGTADEAAAKAAAGWGRDFGLGRDAESTLVGFAREWVSDYADRLALAPRDVVLALEAELGRGSAPKEVRASDVSRLRGELLDIQARVERELRAKLGVSSKLTVPTYFLLTR